MNNPAVVPVYPAPPGAILVGSNPMNRVAFPIIVSGGDAGDRYFHAYLHDGKVVWDVFLWHPNLQCPMYEVRRSMPAVDGAWETVEGIVYTAMTEGDDFKLEMTGGGAEGEIRIKLPNMTVVISKSKVLFEGSEIMFRDNEVNGAFAGFIIDMNGGIRFAGGAPPEGMVIAQIQGPAEGSAAA